MTSTLVDPPVAELATMPRRQSRLGRALDVMCRPAPTATPLTPATPLSPAAQVAPAAPVVPVETFETPVSVTPVSVTPETTSSPQPIVPFEPPLGGSDRRISRRYQIDGDVLVHRWLASSGGRPRRVLPATPPDAFGRMIDLSTGGVAFESDDDFQIGEELLLTLRANLREPVAPVDLRRLSRAAVLRTVRAPQGGWTIVCRFERALSFEEVHRIGGHLFEATIV
jgi:hypothetical protein